MTASQKSLLWDGVFLFTGIIFALAVLPLIGAGIATLQALYDERNPPVRMKLEEHKYVDQSTLRMKFRVERLSDCEFVRMIGFSGMPRSPMEPATMLRREDGSAPISYPVGSVYISAPWLMSPVFGPQVRLYGYYDCDGRAVRTKLIDEVILP